MPGTEIKLPHEDSEFSSGEELERGATLPENSDLETGDVYDFKSREKINKPLESKTHTEQVRLLHESIGLLNADISQINVDISRRSNLINGMEKFLSNQEIITKQKELNRALLDIGLEYSKTEKHKKELEKDKKLKFFPGDGSFVKKVIRDQAGFDEAEKAIKEMDEKRINIWRERRDSQGETIDINGLIETNNELRHDVQNQFKVRISGDAFMTKRFADELHDQNREAQRILMEKKKEIEEFEKQLAILEAFNT